MTTGRINQLVIHIYVEISIFNSRVLLLHSISLSQPNHLRRHSWQMLSLLFVIERSSKYHFSRPSTYAPGSLSGDIIIYVGIVQVCMDISTLLLCGRDSNIKSFVGQTLNQSIRRRARDLCSQLQPVAGLIPAPQLVIIRPDCLCQDTSFYINSPLCYSKYTCGLSRHTRQTQLQSYQFHHNLTYCCVTSVRNQFELSHTA